MGKLPPPEGDVALACQRCGAVTIVGRSYLSPSSRECRGCQARGDSIREGDTHVLRDAETQISRIRLRYQRGHVSDAGGELSSGDAQTIALSADSRRVTLHATGGWIHRFQDAGIVDRDGFRVFQENPLTGRAVKARPAARSRPLLDPANTFDYVAPIAAPDERAVCQLRKIEPHRVVSEVASSDHESNGLLGSSPDLRMTPVGLLTGGGRLSALSHVIRPAVFATRVTLSRKGAPKGGATQAHFFLSEGLTNAFRVDDELHLTLTPRGGLAVSLLRAGRLMMAIGAVSAVPLGDIQVLVDRSRLSRDVGPPGSSAKPPRLHPVEVTTREEPPRKPTGYHVCVWYRAWPPPHDADECITIVCPGFCPMLDAYAATHLIATNDALKVEY